jgi:hypothetical protein
MANDAGTTSEDRSSRMFEPMTGSDALFLDPSTGRAADDTASPSSSGSAEATAARDPATAVAVPGAQALAAAVRVMAAALQVKVAAAASSVTCRLAAGCSVTAAC